MALGLESLAAQLGRVRVVRGCVEYLAHFRREAVLATHVWWWGCHLQTTNTLSAVPYDAFPPFPLQQLHQRKEHVFPLRSNSFKVNTTAQSWQSWKFRYSRQTRCLLWNHSQGFRGTRRLKLEYVSLSPCRTDSTSQEKCYMHAFFFQNLSIQLRQCPKFSWVSSWFSSSQAESNRPLSFQIKCHPKLFVPCPNGRNIKTAFFRKPHHEACLGDISQCTHVSVWSEQQDPYLDRQCHHVKTLVKLIALSPSRRRLFSKTHTFGPHRNAVDLALTQDTAIKSRNCWWETILTKNVETPKTVRVWSHAHWTHVHHTQQSPYLIPHRFQAKVQQVGQIKVVNENFFS